MHRGCRASLMLFTITYRGCVLPSCTRTSMGNILLCNDVIHGISYALHCSTSCIHILYNGVVLSRGSPTPSKRVILRSSEWDNPDILISGDPRSCSILRIGVAHIRRSADIIRSSGSGHISDPLIWRLLWILSYQPPQSP